MQETEKFENTGCCREQNSGEQGSNTSSACEDTSAQQETVSCEREQGCGATEYEQKIEQLTAQLSALQTQYAHVTADMHNFRQRVEKERIQWVAHAQADVIKKLLPVIDNFDRGLQEAAKHEQDQAAQDITGFNMIYNSLLKTLTGLGVELMTDFTVFDPEKHEAVVQVDSPEHKTDDVVAVLEKGYMFKGEVLRPAKVSVAR